MWGMGHVVKRPTVRCGRHIHPPTLPSTLTPPISCLVRRVRSFDDYTSLPPAPLDITTDLDYIRDEDSFLTEQEDRLFTHDVAFRWEWKISDGDAHNNATLVARKRDLHDGGGRRGVCPF